MLLMEMLIGKQFGSIYLKLYNTTLKDPAMLFSSLP